MRMENMSSFCTPHDVSSDDIMGTVAILILGAGLLALFAGYEYFFLIFVFGYAVVLPLIAIHVGKREDGENTDTERATDETSTSEAQASTSDALAVLRERYARGDLTDKQFERKLDRLFETETPEQAQEWRDRIARPETETRYS